MEVHRTVIKDQEGIHQAFNYYFVELLECPLGLLSKDESGGWLIKFYHGTAGIFLSNQSFPEKSMVKLVEDYRLISLIDP